MLCLQTTNIFEISKGLKQNVGLQKTIGNKGHTGTLKLIVCLPTKQQTKTTQYNTTQH